jgi:hypothetical protein
MPNDNCTHTDADHEAAHAHATTTFATFNRIAKERDLCMGACHAALMVDLMEEVAAHTEEPADFVAIIAETIFAATGLRLTNVVGVAPPPAEGSVH